MQKIKNIEALRFLFILSVIACHLDQGITNVVENPIYKNFCAFTHWSWLPVDFFFIISGFFLFANIDYSQGFLNFAIKKLKRLMPTVLGVLLITFIVSLLTPFNWIKHENLFTILNIQNVGLTLQNGSIPPSWFVSSLFWGMCFYFYLGKIFSKNVFNFVTACLIFVCYSIFVHVPNSWNIMNYCYFINMGMVRALAGIGLGYFVRMLYNDYSEVINLQFNSLKSKIIFSALEIYLFFTLFYYLCFHASSYNNVLFEVIIFLLLFICFLIHKGILSKLLENNLSVFLGKFTYSIFLSHYLIKDLWNIYIMNKCQHFVIYHPIMNIVSIFVVSIIVGILTYYLIEKPSAKFLRNKLNANDNANFSGGVTPIRLCNCIDIICGLIPTSELTRIIKVSISFDRNFLVRRLLQLKMQFRTQEVNG